MPAPPRAARLLAALVIPLLLAPVACGGPWKEVSTGNLDETTRSLGAEYARFTLNDDRVIELRVLSVAYPWVEGHRVLGKWSTTRKLRVDLREVRRVEIRNQS